MLRSRASPIAHVGEEEWDFLLSMLINMWHWHGIGLAAPQVGTPLRLIVAEVEGVRIALGNPVVLGGKGAEKMTEGCLTLPGSEVDVRRQTSIWVRAVDIKDRTSDFSFNGLLGRVVQHELDHLNGVLIIDHGLVVQRQTLERGDA